MKIRKLKSIRLVLIIIAVLLSLAIAAVRIFWIPAAAEPEMPPRENSGISSSQSEQESTSPTLTTTDPEDVTTDTTHAETENEYKPHSNTGNSEAGPKDGKPLGGDNPELETAPPVGTPETGEQEEDDQTEGDPNNGGTTNDGQDDSGAPKPVIPWWPGNRKDEDPDEPTGADETTAPNETTGPDDTTAPDETTEPDETTAPDETTGPDETTAPDETTGPDETIVPDETAEPDETIVPDENTAPEETAAPENHPEGQFVPEVQFSPVPETVPAENIPNVASTTAPPQTDAESDDQDDADLGWSDSANGTTERLVEDAAETGEKMSASVIVLYVLCGLLGADIVAIIVVSVQIKKKVQKAKKAENHNMTQYPQEQTARENVGSTGIQVGQLHNIGARPYQEDSSGVSMLDDGILAIVADGMGGLSGGDKVSQKIVYTMLGYGDQLRPGYIDGALERMVHGVNETVNNMLGPDGLYKSGSTLLAVLVRGNRFHWIAVGDSHIYYFHNGRLVQLNEEHNRGQELLHMAARGEITYEEARNAPKKNGLTSFIGMGKLKYVDKSLDSIPLVPGDRILLMTDGVFNALPDQTIEAIMNTYPNVQEAAAEMERLVIQRANPRQDNFTAVIIGF